MYNNRVDGVMEVRYFYGSYREVVYFFYIGIEVVFMVIDVNKC